MQAPSDLDLTEAAFDDLDLVEMGDDEIEGVITDTAESGVGDSGVEELTEEALPEMVDEFPPVVEDVSPEEYSGEPEEPVSPPQDSVETEPSQEKNLESFSSAADREAPPTDLEEDAPVGDEDSPFEVFTRDPGERTAPPPPLEEEGPFREISFDSSPSAAGEEAFSPESVEEPATGGDEVFSEEGFDGEPEETAAAAEEAVQGKVIDLVDEIPGVDLHDEVEAEAPTVESEIPGEGDDQSVFDTDTLANLYIDQGFYRKAAEVYERMLVSMPEDLQLRQKLEDVLALEKMQSAREENLSPPPEQEPSPVTSGDGDIEVPVETAAAPPASPVAQEASVPDDAPVSVEPPPSITATSSGGEGNPKIVKLQRLLKSLKGRRP